MVIFVYLHAVIADIDFASGGGSAIQVESPVVQFGAVLLLADCTVLKTFGNLKKRQTC